MEMEDSAFLAPDSSTWDEEQATPHKTKKARIVLMIPTGSPANWCAASNSAAWPYYIVERAKTALDFGLVYLDSVSENNESPDKKSETICCSVVVGAAGGRGRRGTRESCRESKSQGAADSLSNIGRGHAARKRAGSGVEADCRGRVTMVYGWNWKNCMEMRRSKNPTTRLEPQVYFDSQAKPIWTSNLLLAYICLWSAGVSAGANHYKKERK
jgi:hypothetical protein